MNMYCSYKTPMNIIVVQTIKLPCLNCPLEIFSWNINIVYLFFKQGSTYEDEIHNIKCIISKINAILAHNSPVLIVQRWIRGFLVRKNLRYVLFSLCSEYLNKKIRQFSNNIHFIYTIKMIFYKLFELVLRKTSQPL